MTRILCLHGGGASGDILHTQLAPVLYELAKTAQIHFDFLTGPVEAPAAPGLGEQFEGPFYRFFDKDAPHIIQFAGLSPSPVEQAQSPQEFGRAMRETGMVRINSSTTCDFLEQHLAQHRNAPYDGVLGFSEGASVAAALMLRQNSQGKAWPFQFAIFICGVPPFRWDSNDVLLPNETAQRIHIPTAHVLGAEDPKRHASRIMYELCQESCASLDYHGGDHTIPWDLKSTALIAEAILKVLRRSQNSPVA